MAQTSVQSTQDAVNNHQPQQQPHPAPFQGTREEYIKICIPLYEAAIKCDWNAAKAIIDNNPDKELVRCSISGNDETALHVAASAKGPKHAEEFVKKLVEMMSDDDLKLQEGNDNTALHLAAIGGNIKMVKIMVNRSRDLLTIANRAGMMPLYIAALYENEEVVKFLYNESNMLNGDDGWTDEYRGWLLENCVESDMFDVALVIVKTYPQLCTGSVLEVLARKPESFPETNWGRYLFSKMFVTQQPGRDSETIRPFPETKSSFIKSVFAYMGLKYEKETNALLLLRFIWGVIVTKPTSEIDDIIKGSPDPIEDDQTVSGRAIQVLQLKKLISKHVDKMDKETNNIISVKVDVSGQLQNLISEELVRLHAETQKIIEGSPHNTIKPIPDEENTVMELQKLIFEHIAGMYRVINEDRVSEQRLQDVIFKHIEEMSSETERLTKLTGPTKESYSSRILFIAAENGNTKFVVELICKYPDLIWKVNDNNQSIFHVAVKHRREGIYNLLYEIGAMKNLITPLRDRQDNSNMLHLVGKSATKTRLADVSGVVALQMQRQLLWFKEVESIIPPSYREQKNKDGLTPYELFTKEHKDLITQGEKWIKETANQCMVVAALIATIVFTVAFTAPGGYNGADIQTNNQTNNQTISGQHDGMPVLLSETTFKVFVVADAISLFASSASIITFLSILMSRYAERDFLKSLPTKLVFGLATLFLAITTMTLAFSVSFFVLYRQRLVWMPIIISALGVFLVLLYMYLQSSLFFDVLRSTYGSNYLFKPKKHVLYYKNPKV